MRKIYLAISGNSDMNLVKSLFEKDREVIELADVNEVIEILYEDYDFCIIDANSFSLDRKSVDPSRLKGEILFFNESQSQNGPGPIQSFETISRLMTWYKVKGLANRGNSANSPEKTAHSSKDEETNLPVKEQNSEETEVENKREGFDSKTSKPPHPTETSKEKEKLQDNDPIQHKKTDNDEKRNESNNTTPSSSKENKAASLTEPEQNLLISRAADIRKKVFSQASWERNRTIGVWSPLHRMGVSLFVINFALFLSKLHVPTAVVESLTEYQILKTTLKRYGSMPEKWVSFIQAIQNPSIPVENVKWTYRGVHWMPLGDNDASVTWDKEMLQSYLGNVKYFDVVLVDLPAGDMKPYTLDSLEYIDELWIMVDDSYQQILAWKRYIDDIQKKYNLSIKLIFNRHTSSSKQHNLESGLGFPLIATLPDLTKSIYQNYYENRPLIDSNHVYSTLKEPYKNLAVELLGNEYVAAHLKEGYFQRLRSFLIKT